MNWTKRFFLTCLLAFTPVLGIAQTLVNCAPATPCTMSGPSNTGTGDHAWLAFGKINTDLLVLAPLFNSTGLPFTLPVTSGGTGATTLTGLIKGNGTSPFSAATSADVISRWSGTCNATTFLRADGSCQAAGSLPSIANNTLLGNISGSTTTPVAITLPTLGIGDTPLKEGAIGDGIANDTTPVQNCVNTLYCLLPAGYNFKVSSPIQVPNGGTLIGQSTRTSILTGNSVVGGVVQVGDGGATWTGRVTLKNFRIKGTATNAVKVNWASPVYLDNIFVGADVNEIGFPVWTDAFFFDRTFDSRFTYLQTNGATIGQTATFTASVGGATTGTLTASLPAGIYDFIFRPSREQRPVTVSAGTTATWPVALAAGTVTTASFGSAFRIGGAFNANYSANWIASSNTGYGIYQRDDFGSGTSGKSTFDAMSIDSATIGLFVDDANSFTFNSLYTEDVVFAIWLGNYALHTIEGQGQNITFNSPGLSIPGSGHTDYSMRLANIVIDRFNGVVLNAPSFTSYGIAAAAPLTFSGGGTTTQAKGYGLVNAAGVIKAAVVTFPGAGYSSNPTVAVGGVGSSGAVTAVQSGGIITTANLTVTNGGSGYVSPPMPVYYNVANQILINSPFVSMGGDNQGDMLWPWIVSGPNPANSGITIINDSAASYNDPGVYYTPATLTRAPYSGGLSVHWLSWLSGTGPQGAPPTTKYLLVVPPAFP